MIHNRQSHSLHTAKRRLSALFAAVFLSFAVFSVFSASAAPVADAAQTQPEYEAFDPLADDASYSFVLYNNTSGLPTSEANVITQTSDGFIWIGSYGGLVRYDGSRFERIDSPLGISSVISLFADSKDRLWVGYNDSGLAMFNKSETRHWGINEGLKSLAVTCITEDRSGTIYVGTKDGVLIVDENMNLIPLNDERILDNSVTHMQESPDGLIYCLTLDRDVFTIKDGRLVRYYPGSTIPVPDIQCILPDETRAGYVYFGTHGSGVHYCVMRGTPQVEHVYSEDALATVESLTYIGETIWACTDVGVVVISGEEAEILDQLPVNNKVSHVMADYEGNLWLTSNRQGVLKITPNRFTDLFMKYSIPSAVVNTTCVYEDKLFVGTDTGLVVIDNNGVCDTLRLKQSASLYGTYYTDLIDVLKNERIRSLNVDSRDRMWISTWRDFGLLCYDHGVLTPCISYGEIMSTNIRTVCEKQDGTIVVATNRGLCTFKGDYDPDNVREYGKEAGIDNTVILTVCEGFDGEILAGSDGGGIYIVRDDKVSKLTIQDGLSSDTILRLRRDRTRDLIWIISSNSISYMTPDHRITVIEDFPYSNNLDLVQNSRDEMWVLSSNGIYVVPTEQMLANREIDPEHYSIKNGLTCTATANSYNGLSENGDFYLSGNTGVVYMNIENGFDSDFEYRASVPYIEADEETLYPNADGSFVISSETKQLTIHAFVFNYSLMTPQVSYSLEGFSDRYTTVAFDDLTPIVYTNLKGGEYRFVMKIYDPLSKNVQTVTVKIVKEKAFYEHPWFYIAVGFATVLLLVAVARAFYQNKINRMQRRHREEVEKERISTELDTASRIQSGMLPCDFPPFPDRKEFDLYASMDPAKEVGGDFYDFFMIDDDHLCLVIADVSGKGVPAALVMMSAMIIIRNCAEMGKSPAEILTTTNDQICSHNREEMFVTVWLGILEISTGKLTASNAGHEYPVLMQPDERFALFKDKHSVALGCMEGIRYKQYDVELRPGAKLFVYTDGVPEASDSSEELFGAQRMVDALNEDSSLPPQGILQKVREAVDSFVKDAEQFDDLTMLCLEYNGPDGGKE